MNTLELLRQFRLGEYAIFDFAVSFLAFYLLAPFLSKLFRKFRLDIPKRSWLYLALPIGVFVHIFVGEITPMTKDFLDLGGHYLLKVVMLVLVYLGVRRVKVLK